MLAHSEDGSQPMPASPDPPGSIESAGRVRPGPVLNLPDQARPRIHEAGTVPTRRAHCTQPEVSWNAEAGLTLP